MQIVIAPDSFKHSLSAKEAAQSIARGIRNVMPDVETTLVPVADGGEGTVHSLVDATGGRIEKLQVHDPLMRKINSFFGVLGDGKTAVIEMAAASGIELLSDKELDPMKASTFGTGELMKKALDLGCNKIIIGIGGSATNDGGMGMARALGVKFADENGDDVGEGGGALGNVATIDDSKIDERLMHCEVVIAADVTNPLTGQNGAAYVYGPQKGASEKQVLLLDKNLAQYGILLYGKYRKDIAMMEGSGAAGGLGAGLLAFAGARLRHGFDIVEEITGLEEKIIGCDLVITGEGKIDHQTQFGKTPFGVASLAKKYNKPVIAFAGTLGEQYHELYDKGFDVIFPVTEKPVSLKEALNQAETLLTRAAERMARMLLVSKKL